MTTYERSSNADTNAKHIVILHGWGDSAKGWRALRGELAKDYNVTVVDLPGFGGTDSPHTAWGLTEYAAFVGSFIKKLELKPDVIIGHSNGGAIAVRGLAEGSLSAERLILLASAGIRSELQGRRRVLRMVTKVGKAITFLLPATIKKSLRRRLYATIGSDLLVSEHMQETFKRIVTDDIQADAAQLTLPTLLVYGQDDMAAPVHYGRILHSLIAGSNLETISQAGHFVHLDKPEQVQAMIRKFLQ